MVNVKVVQSYSALPSDTKTSTETEPLKSGAGITVKLVPTTTISAASSLVAENVKASPSTSLADRVNVSEASSSMT